ncbi:hypothetical protein [Azospirillum argentinense]
MSNSGLKIDMGTPRPAGSVGIGFVVEVGADLINVMAVPPIKQASASRVIRAARAAGVMRRLSAVRAA